MCLFIQVVMESKEDDNGKRIFTAEQKKKKMSFVPEDRLLYACYTDVTVFNYCVCVFVCVCVCACVCMCVCVCV